MGYCRDLPGRQGGLRYVSAPMIFRPRMRQLRFNRWAVARLCRRMGIGLVFNASALWHMTAAMPGICSVYDLVDDHASLAGDDRMRPVIDRVIEHECRKSSAVVTISHALVGLIQDRYDRHAHYVPNGVDMGQMAGVSDADVQALRGQWKLQGKFVIGCIGNHGSWSGLGLLIESFRAVQREMPDAVLLIVGPGAEVDRYRSASGEGIVFTGPVPPREVYKYFRMIDVGTLPFDLLPFTENALPIKVLEYGASGKWTLASPLKELKTLNLPGVKFAEHSVAAWAQAMRESRSLGWDAAWTARYADFDWKRIAEGLCGVLEKAREGARA